MDKTQEASTIIYFQAPDVTSAVKKTVDGNYVFEVNGEAIHTFTETPTAHCFLQNLSQILEEREKEKN